MPAAQRNLRGSEIVCDVVCVLCGVCCLSHLGSFLSSLCT